MIRLMTPLGAVTLTAFAAAALAWGVRSTRILRKETVK